MVYNDAAFDHLVYDEQQKDLVMSFVESHSGSGAVSKKHPKAMQDVIAGKGEFGFLLSSSDARPLFSFSRSVFSYTRHLIASCRLL